MDQKITIPLIKVVTRTTTATYRNGTLVSAHGTVNTDMAITPKDPE